MTFKTKLQKLGACKEAIEWVGDMTLEQAWKKCQRGDWMLWLYAKMYPENKRELTLAKAHCTNTVRQLMKDERSRKAVDIAIAYGEGNATEAQLKNAANAADAAYAAANAANAAYAAVAAAYAAAAAAADAAYAAAAANAAYAVVSSANAKRENLMKTAKICRKYLKIQSEVK